MKFGSWAIYFIRLYSPRDGRHLLTEIDSDAVFWNVESGAEEKRLDSGVYGICVLSADQTTVVSAGSKANEVRIWNIADGRLRFTLLGHTEGLLSVAIARNGATAATGGYNGAALVWDLQSGVSKAVLNDGQGDRMDAVAFSSSGLRLATASDAVPIWNVATGTLERKFSADHISSLAYSPDDHLLAGASREGSLSPWRLD